MALNWHSKGIDEVCDWLQTDEKQGLDRKTVSFRFRKDGENAVFRLPDAGLRHSLGVLFRGFCFLLLFATVAVYAFAFPGAPGLIASVVFLSFAAVGTFAYAWAESVLGHAAERSLPRVRVVRDGAEKEIDMRGIVRGDVVLLGEGDIVPCDLYITSTAGDVRVLEGRVTGVRTPAEKYACIIEDENAPPAERKNIAYAASIVRSGTIRGIAVETGRSCAVVMKNGEVPVYSGGEAPLYGEIRAFSSKLGLRLLIAAALVILIGFIRHGNGENLFVSFLSALALGAACVSELTEVVFSVIAASAIHRGMKASTPHLIKNVGAIGNIASIDTLVVKSTLLLGGGDYEAAYLSTPDENTPQSALGVSHSRGMRYLSECAILSSSYIAQDYREGKREGTDDARAVSAIGELSARVLGDHRHYTVLLSRPADDTFAFDTAVLQGSNSTFAVASGDAEAILASCNRYIEDGRMQAIDGGVKEKIRATVTRYRTSGFRVVAFARNDYDYEDLKHAEGVHARMQFIGVVALRKVPSRAGLSFLAACREKKTRVILLHDGTPSDVTAMLASVPGYEQPNVFDARLPSNRDRAIDLSLAGYDIYASLTPTQKESLVTALTGARYRVGVYSDCFEDYRMTFAADATFTEGTTADFSGDVSHAEIDRRCRAIVRGADVLVGGGIRSLGDALNDASSICRLSGSTLRYMALSLALRVVVTLFGMIVGQPFLTPVQIMILSLVLDPIAVAVAATGASGMKDVRRVTFRYWHEFRGDIGLVAGGAVFTCATPYIFSLLHKPLTGDETCAFAFLLCTSVSLLCMIDFLRPARTRRACLLIGIPLPLLLIGTLIPPFRAVFGTFSLRALAAFAVALGASLAVHLFVRLSARHTFVRQQ